MTSSEDTCATLTGRSRIVQVHPTRRCNLRCRHCYSQSGPEERDTLDVALLRAFLRDARGEGYDVLGVSGGEPLVYPQLGELLDAARALGMRTTATTNGTLLTPERVGALVGRLDLLAVSCDGVPESHDEMRASPGAFEKLDAGLDVLAASGIPFGLIFTLTQHNLDELPSVATFAVEKGAKLLQIHPLEETGRAATTLVGERPDGTEGGYAFVVAHELRKHFGDALVVQVDLVASAQLRARAERFVGRSHEAPTDAPLAELLEPLIVEPDGAVVPFQYGFPRRHALGSLHDKPLATMAARWKRTGREALTDVRRRAHDAALGATDAPVANWYEAMRLAAG